MTDLKLDKEVARLNALRAHGVPLLSVKLPQHYARLVEAEVKSLGRKDGPLYSVVYPRAGRFDTFVAGEEVNFVEDFSHMPEGLHRVVVHRYPYKLLYFPTDMCVPIVRLKFG